MDRWIRAQYNGAGEWFVTDYLRDYRICNYNHALHGGPHLHVPLDGAAGAPVPFSDMRMAEQFLHWFAERHETFDEGDFLREATRWRSALNRG